MTISMDKSNKIFVDSNFFIALLNPQDTLNTKAITISSKIKDESPSLVISNFIFLEIVTILSQRIDRKTAITFGNHLLQDNQIEILHINESLQEKCWKAFQKMDKKNISFVDCSILAVMEAEKINTLLTFDLEDFVSLKKIYKFDFYNT